MTVTFYRPDGSLHLEKQVVATDEADGYTVYKLSLSDLGTPGTIEYGVWIVEYIYQDISRQFAYHHEPPSVPQLRSICQNGRSKMLIQHSLNESESLIQLLNFESEANNLWQTTSIDIVEEWSVTLDTSGRRFLTVDSNLIPESDFFHHVFALDPFSDLPTTIDETHTYISGERFTRFPSACGPFMSLSDAITEPVLYGFPLVDLLSSSGDGHYYAFNATVGEQLNFEVETRNSVELDTTLTLLDAEGTVIAENDDALEPNYGIFDPALTDVEILADGVYVIKIEALFGNGDYVIYTR